MQFALESPSVREAARSLHWREVYVCAPIEGGQLLEGYIDLLYRTPEGLVVVDYKTASSSDPEYLDEGLEGYRLQGGSYALGIGLAIEVPSPQVRFLFLTPDGVTERHLSEP